MGDRKLKKEPLSHFKETNYKLCTPKLRFH